MTPLKKSKLSICENCKGNLIDGYHESEAEAVACKDKRELKDLVPKKAAANDLIKILQAREKFIIASIVTIFLVLLFAGTFSFISGGITMIYTILAALQLKTVKLEIVRLKTTYKV